MLKLIYEENAVATGIKSYVRAIYRFFLDNSFRVQCRVRQIEQINNKKLKSFFLMRLEKKYSIKIGNNAHIGKGFKINHYEGIVIGENVVIGDDCSIFQHVTIGQKNGKYPIIMNNVTMYPGCVIIGDIKIHNNAIIAPNSVVIEDVPENTIVSGVPAQIIVKEK